MKNIALICVAAIGAALPATLEAGAYPANANSGIAAGGCFGPNYRSQAVQHVRTNYAPGSSYSPSGQYNHLNYSAAASDYYPNGQWLPRNDTAGTVDDCPNGYCPTSTTGTANCPANGYCPTHGVYHSARANDRGSSNWHGTRYNTLPATWNSGSYPTRPVYDVNWSDSYRPVPPSTFGSTASPFFN